MNKKRITTTTIDRLRALVRNPQYLKGLKELEEGTYDVIKREEFCLKYGIYTPIKPELLERNAPEMLEYCQIFRDFITKVIPADDKVITTEHPVYSKDFKETIIDFEHDFSPHLEDNRYLTLKIDLLQDKKDIMAAIKSDMEFYGKYVKKEQTRDTESRTIDRFLVWDEYKTSRKFSKIAKKHKVNKATVRKAYYRAFELIMGETYDPERHNKKNLTKEQLSKTCEICPEYKLCNDPCPDVLSFIEQDNKAGLSVRNTENMPDNSTNETDLLLDVSKIIKRRIDNFDDLTDNEKNILKEHSFIVSLKK